MSPYLPTSSTLALESSTITRPSSPILSSFRPSGIYTRNSQADNKGNDDYNILGGRSGILLNKEREDLCWDCLFMVCGGTGITPMLQLVSYNFNLFKFL